REKPMKNYRVVRSRRGLSARARELGPRPLASDRFASSGFPSSGFPSSRVVSSLLVSGWLVSGLLACGASNGTLFDEALGGGAGAAGRRRPPAAAPLRLGPAPDPSAAPLHPAPPRRAAAHAPDHLRPHSTPRQGDAFRKAAGRTTNTSSRDSKFRQHRIKQLL